MQENRRYSEEISEEQFRFYTSKNYVAGDDSHKIHILREDEKPEINENQMLVPSLEVTDEGAFEHYEVVDKPIVESQQSLEDRIAELEAIIKSLTETN
jgi:hypothetical protein